MLIYVALGNPGVEYELSRHNFGWLVADEIEDRVRILSKKQTESYRLLLCRYGGQDLAVCKPQTYMNRSGLAVANLLRERGCEIEDLIVLHDDLDIPFGQIRLKFGGGHGGHKGLISILRELGRDDFLRMRLGIGTDPHPPDGSEYVLGPFPEEETEALERVIANAADAALELLHSDYKQVMNRINRRELPSES
jgi:PTH1 family peptidyl-tRNA hydrolase